MAATFAQKFEQALAEKRKADSKYGLRTLARELADDDPHQTEIIRRRLHKYRPRPGGGTAAVAPTAPTRWEIEDAMGLERDALMPDEAQSVVAEFLDLIAPFRAISRFAERVERGELAVTK